MRLKSLIKKFGYSELFDVANKEGWEVPTLKQLKSLSYDYEDKDVWVNIPHEDINHAYVYNKKANKLITVHKMFMEYAVVIVNDKCCNCCENFDNKIGNCMQLQLLINNPMEFYCAYFIRKHDGITSG